ncbi:hypothetical protein J23TS9_56830 [Paenibacillus sp. J23TS9]|uniref:hypothetical protein n=1 Tax=Paenibacillus sp. J23TS9 TaxID=2807193 RepID=UPI001B036A30|nr:hypothetical protein [Paenibacillus sp. J23TS9]GIP30553.1 hypothetical protein J23TS9_56830 [Paenibacillus sp. J23TS9]
MNTYNQQQISQLVQQLIQQTQQASQKYEQLLRQEQSNAAQLEQMAQREQQAAQTIQTALQGHQHAIQQLQQISNLAHQLNGGASNDNAYFNTFAQQQNHQGMGMGGFQGFQR